MSRLISSFDCAIKGLIDAFVSGANMKIHLLAALTALAVGWWLKLSALEWAIISLTIFFVLAAETFNSAIEVTVDLVTQERHPLAGRAKDLAAGGVLLAAVNALVVAVLLLLPKALHRL
jgi:diacylglycerol kinase (ATP)